MKPYYYVYRYQNQAPKVRHPTLQAAQAEAERLAGENPGITYEILKVVGISKVHAPGTTFWMDGEEPTDAGA